MCLVARMDHQKILKGNISTMMLDPGIVSATSFSSSLDNFSVSNCVLLLAGLSFCTSSSLPQWLLDSSRLSIFTSGHRNLKER